MGEHKFVSNLRENVAAVPTEEEFLAIKSDVMPFSIYGAGPVTFVVCAVPCSASASAVICMDGITSGCVVIN